MRTLWGLIRAFWRLPGAGRSPTRPTLCPGELLSALWMRTGSFRRTLPAPASCRSTKPHSNNNKVTRWFAVHVPHVLTIISSLRIYYCRAHALGLQVSELFWILTSLCLQCQTAA